jgi:glycosyltransferase A (GT-A) superfamily protein (DUF2064 family)
MDTPQVGPGELQSVLGALDGPGRPAVLGHAVDGGWWVIGFARPASHPPNWYDVFRSVPMSTPSTGARQERRLRSLGFDVIRAGVHRDIDTLDDLQAVATAAPLSRTAAVARRLRLIEKAA